MAKIVIFPLLTMTSGHHKVADTVADKMRDKGHDVVKIDILSTSWSNLEKSITSIYKRVLGMFPKSYEALYRFIAGPENCDRNITRALSSLFSYSMKSIIANEKPDFIICTHGFPSAILNSLKKKNKCSIPVANIYTDFFINNFWGCSHIEYHFVSSLSMKQIILKRNRHAVIFKTGIPINDIYKSRELCERSNESILITGGSGGYGSILSLINKLKPSGKLNYSILCGSNKRLYTQICNLSNDSIRAFSYLTDPKEVCNLYDKSRIVIGKPGGITITETLNRKCIFYVYSFLPGQEYYNYNFLKSQGLILDGFKKSISELMLLNLLNDNRKMKTTTKNINDYLTGLKPNIADILDETVNNVFAQKIGGVISD